MTCVGCGTELGPPDANGWRKCPRGHGSFLYSTPTSYLRTENFSDPLDRAEDEAQLADYLAASGIGVDRSMGG